MVDGLVDGIAGNASPQGHDAKQDHALPESASPSPVAAPHAARILLAEDSIANQVVATAMLARQGYDVEVANNGREAVEHFATGSYDLILMDLRMPELDGLQATAAIRSMPGGDRIPIVAMTANAMQEDVERCLAAGMDDFVAKPVDRRQLFDTLARHLPVVGKPAPESGAEARQAGADRGEPLLDEAVIQQLAEDVSEAAIPGMMKTFVDEVMMRAGRVLSALQDSAAADLEDEAHTLKSSAGTFGALRLQGLARDIEAACREGNRATAEKLGRGLGTLVEETLAVYRERFDVPPQTGQD
jgi:CheY-like chemotaxis protein